MSDDIVAELDEWIGLLGPKGGEPKACLKRARHEILVLRERIAYLEQPDTSYRAAALEQAARLCTTLTVPFERKTLAAAIRALKDQS